MAWTALMKGQLLLRTTARLVGFTVASAGIIGLIHLAESYNRDRSYPAYRESLSSSCGVDVEEIRTAGPLARYVQDDRFLRYAGPDSLFERQGAWLNEFLVRKANPLSLARVEYLFEYAPAVTLRQAVIRAELIVMGRAGQVTFEPREHWGTATTFTLAIDQVLKGVPPEELVIEMPGGPVRLPNYPDGILGFLDGAPLPLLLPATKIILFLSQNPWQPQYYYIHQGSGFYLLEEGHVRALPTQFCPDVDWLPESNFIAEVKRFAGATP